MTTDTIERELTDLVVIPASDALKIFAAERKPGETHPIEPILAKVRAAIDAFEPDMSTAKGRDEIRSFAHRVTKAKTALEAVGKELADEQKNIPKRIDATRKHIKDTLDAWRDEVRKPLTDWEEAEEKRVEAIKSILEEWKNLAADQTDRHSVVLRERLAEMERESVTQERFAEFLSAAGELKATAIAHLQNQIARAEKREAEAAELEALRREKAERDARETAEREAREAKEREERIAREAEERARRQAEAAAQAKIEAAERAAREEKEAAEKVLREEREKIERERREAEAKAAQEAKEKAAREADTEHRRKINQAAVAALTAHGIGEVSAMEVIKLIATGQVPGVRIIY